MSWIKHCLTEADNETYDLGRVLAALAILVGLGLEVFSVVYGKHFDMQGYGVGLGAIFVSVGAYLGLKKEQP